MSLRDKLSAIQQAYRPPSLKVTIGSFQFRFRDLSAEEETFASEYSYLKLAESPNSVELGGDPQLYARSMRSALYYRIAYVAVAIRSLLWEENGESHSLDVDVHPETRLEIDGEQVQKFKFFVTLVAEWNSHVVSEIFEAMETRREKFREKVGATITSENVESPPKTVEEDKRFQKIEIDEEVVPGEDDPFEQSSSFREPEVGE